MAKWKTIYNQADHPDPGELNKGVSLTIPDQAMTITELVRRYTQGYVLPGKETMYEGYEDDPDSPWAGFEQMDFQDKQMALNAAREENEVLQDQIKARVKKLEEDKKEAQRKRDEEAAKKQAAMPTAGEGANAPRPPASEV